MIESDAINKIEELVRNSYTVEVAGKAWTAKELKPVIYEPKIQGLNVSTLTGFIEFIERNIDRLNLEKDYFIQVSDVDRVSLISTISEIKKEREIPLTACIDSNMESFPFNKFLDREDFMIKLLSFFEKRDSDDFEYIASTVSKITQQNTIDINDDGITQRVTVRKGLSGALVNKENVKPIVKLAPYRTFREIDQVESQFLLRICENSKGQPEIALFEADGGQWRNQARLRIAEYLKSSVKVSVIA